MKISVDFWGFLIGKLSKNKNKFFSSGLCFLSIIDPRSSRRTNVKNVVFERKSSKERDDRSNTCKDSLFFIRQITKKRILDVNNKTDWFG